MDEVSRLASNVQQLTQRVDDMSLRLALVEKEQLYVDEKISDLKVLIIEKNQELRNELGKWNKIGVWLITLVGGWFIIQTLGLIQNAG